jgi:aminoglycoside phosphotransferase (APT) family kinase protein
LVRAEDDCVMVTAAGLRIGWDDLPRPVRLAVEDILGDQIIDVRSQVGGFSPGTADRVVTAAGRRAFVKAASPGLNERTVELHRREALVAAALPAEVPAPALRGVHDDGEWIALVFDDVGGRCPRTPWVAAEFAAAVTALDQLAAVPVPGTLRRLLPDLGVMLADDLDGWRRIADDPPGDLDAWTVRHLDQLRDLGDRAAGVLTGDRLVHADIRADNLILRADDAVTIVDWPWASVGVTWFDRLMLLVNVRCYGGQLSTGIDADPDDITAVLAGVAGYFVDAARQPPPPGLPTVRAFQAAQGRVVQDWLRQRFEAPDST